MRNEELANPTIVLLTDRNDLDGQLFGVFSLAQDLLREQPVQAHTRQELRTLLANRISIQRQFCQRLSALQSERVFCCRYA